MSEYIVKNTLIAEVYTIGYEPEGEGIVLKIIVDGYVTFCAVIDCYERDNKNKTLELIEGIEKIDLICMTHPDTDHCKGLEKILEKANSNTKILFPSGIFDRTYSPFANNVIEKIAKYLQKNKNNSATPKLITCCENTNIEKSIAFKSIKTGEIYKLEINTYSPITEIIEKGHAMSFLRLGERKTENNEFSIMTSISIGDFKMLFCGDIEDDTIDEVCNKMKQNNFEFFNGPIDYLKIPHHSSKSSIAMFDLLSDVSFIANSVTTVFRKCSLPNEEILRQYENKSDDLYCTSKLDRTQNLEKYGVVKLTIDLLEKNIKVENFLNATKIKFNKIVEKHR